MLVSFCWLSSAEVCCRPGLSGHTEMKFVFVRRWIECDAFPLNPGPELPVSSLFCNFQLSNISITVLQQTQCHQFDHLWVSCLNKLYKSKISIMKWLGFVGVMKNGGNLYGGISYQSRPSWCLQQSLFYFLRFLSLYSTQKFSEIGLRLFSRMLSFWMKGRFSHRISSSFIEGRLAISRPMIRVISEKKSISGTKDSEHRRKIPGLWVMEPDRWCPMIPDQK